VNGLFLVETVYQFLMDPTKAAVAHHQHTIARACRVNDLPGDGI